MSYGPLFRGLARDRGISRATRRVADQIARRAEQIDPTADCVVEEITVNVDGLVRKAHRVVNRSETAGDSEFGNGEPPLRPLGRAAAEFRDRRR